VVWEDGEGNPASYPIISLPLNFSRRGFLAESVLPFIQAAWRRREGGARAVGSAAGASVVRRGGGGTTELADYGSVRRAWEDRHVIREIIGYYSGHLDAEGSAPHEAGGCKGSYRWNRFHAAALRIA
jgi:hypothetical protein